MSQNSLSRAEELTQEGQFGEAVRPLEDEARRQPLEPGYQLMLFSLQVRLQRWDHAERSVG